MSSITPNRGHAMEARSHCQGGNGHSGHSSRGGGVCAGSSASPTTRRAACQHRPRQFRRRSVVSTFDVVNWLCGMVYSAVVKSVTKTSAVRLGRAHPRRNLPTRASRQETNFVVAFGNAYVREVVRQRCVVGRLHAAGRELPVAGFGIADFIWLAWRKAPRNQQGAGLSFHTRPQKAVVLAFEMKLKDWRRALAQAVRYRYFADAAFVVLPPSAAACARQALATFRDMRVGLWSFDKQRGRICKIFTPRRHRPLSPVARQKAIAILSHRLRIPPVV